VTSVHLWRGLAEEGPYTLPPTAGKPQCQGSTMPGLPVPSSCMGWACGLHFTGGELRPSHWTQAALGLQVAGLGPPGGGPGSPVSSSQ
jgi:hypothetical protein